CRGRRAAWPAAHAERATAYADDGACRRDEGLGRGLRQRCGGRRLVPPAAAERNEKLCRIEEALCFGAGETQPRLLQLALRVQDLQQRRVAELEALARQIHGRSGRLVGRLLGGELLR